MFLARSARCARSTRQPAGMTPIIFWLRLRSASARARARRVVAGLPRNTDQWLTSIVQPIHYSVVPPPPDAAVVDALAGLTAVDGATVISDQFEPLAFGTKILTRDGVHRVQQVLLTEPIEGTADRIVDPAHLGGTRHLSAAQFAIDQRDCIALVASRMVRYRRLVPALHRSAHRVEPCCSE